MRCIFARASATYRGRIEADLSTGDFCILVRDIEAGGDGSVMLLKNAGVTPINWMPGGSEIEERDGYIKIEHTARGEILEIFIDRIYEVQHMNFELIGDLTKHGAEKQISDALAEDVSLLGTGLIFIAREFRTSAGPVDLLCEKGKRSKIPICVEVKRRRVTLSDVFQVKRYIHAMDQSDQYVAPTEGILVGEVLAKNAKELIDSDSALSFVRISFSDLVNRNQHVA